jgi:peptidoglycan hydrolase-like protein with peptidoglycan-binding domain
MDRSVTTLSIGMSPLRFGRGPFSRAPDIDLDALLEGLEPDISGPVEYESGHRVPLYVAWIQLSLNRLMGAGLAVDGRIGPKTRAAIRLLQRSRGLAPDGIVGPKTEEALRAAGVGHPPVRRSLVQPSDGAPSGAYGCPVPAQRAVERCIHPGTQSCPAIPNLLCQRGVDGVPFEYPLQIVRSSASGLKVVADRQPHRLQQFVPTVRAALQAFIRNMARFGLPIEAILTAGSLVCRCISKTDTLSNHSFGDAIDIVGVRWSSVGGPAHRLRETIVHNFTDSGERRLLRRIDACLRLSFPTVIDYHDSRHRDHLHCDMNRSRGRRPLGRTILPFVQESLGQVVRANLPVTGKFDMATKAALRQFSGAGSEVISRPSALNRIFDSLFERIASTP